MSNNANNNQSNNANNKQSNNAINKKNFLYLGILFSFILTTQILLASEKKEEAHGASEAAGEHSAEATPAIKTFVIREVDPDFYIPAELWDKIKNPVVKDAMTFNSIRVRFKEKTPGILIAPEFAVDFVKGGGTIDFSHFTTGKNGTFQIFFDTEEFAQGKQFSAFYVSRARKRKLDGEIWGSGCRTYMDLTKYLDGVGKKKGIEVNTTRSRHDSLMGGHFIFTVGHELTRVSFKDSANPHLFCEEVLPQKKIFEEETEKKEKADKKQSH